MNIRLKLLVAIVIVAGLLYVINMIRRKRLEIRYALAWLLLGIGTLLVDLIPGLMEAMARLFGIASPVNMLFFLGFLFSLMLIFVLTVAVSRMSIRIKALTQEIALQEKRREVKEQEQKDKQ